MHRFMFSCINMSSLRAVFRRLQPGESIGQASEALCQGAAKGIGCGVSGNNKIQEGGRI
jgi:hypothetical protein